MARTHQEAGLAILVANLVGVASLGRRLDQVAPARR